MPEIDADAEITRNAQELEVTDEEFKVKFRGQWFSSSNPYNWPADWPDRLNNGELPAVLDIAFPDDDMRELDPPVTLLEALGMLSAIQRSIGNDLGKSRRSGRSSAPTRNISKPTSKPRTKSISSTTGEDE